MPQDALEDSIRKGIMLMKDLIYLLDITPVHRSIFPKIRDQESGISNVSYPLKSDLNTPGHGKVYEIDFISML